MKKRICLWLLLALLCLSCACAGRKISPDSTAVSSNSRIALEQNSWPDHAYTDQVPVFEAGTLTGGWIDTQEQYCYLEFSGVEQTDVDRYIQTLQSHGFRQAASTEEQPQGALSSQVVFLKGKTGVSLQFSGNRCGLFLSQSGYGFDG